MAAGIEHAQGEVLVTMDADLQNDPADIGCLIAKLEEGYDLVVGRASGRTSASRRLPSVIANRLIAADAGVDVKDNGCTLKAFRAELIKQSRSTAKCTASFLPSRLLSVASLPKLTASSSAQIRPLQVWLSRIYRVLLDIMVVKTLITFAGALCSASSASPWRLVALSVTCAALGVFIKQSFVVFATVAVLAGSLALFLAFAGVVSSLVSQYGGDRLAPLQPMLRHEERAQ